MNSKSNQSSCCYRYKLLFLWISSLHILVLFLHSLYFKNVLQEYASTWVGCVVRPKRIFEYRGGWGVQKWPFLGVHTLWMAPILPYSDDVPYCFLPSRKKLKTVNKRSLRKCPKPLIFDTYSQD